MEVYIVKSGMLKDFVGWEWLNLRAFDSFEKAEAYAETVSNQIPPDIEDEFVEIDVLSVRSW